MGADIIGWRNCALQAELEPEGFHAKLKLLAYKRAIEAIDSREDRNAVRVQIRVGDRAAQVVGYTDLVEQLGAFEQGCAACSECPVGGGQSLGCYRYVTFPMDEPFERLLFAFFVEQIPTPSSVGDLMYRVVVSKQPSSGTPFHRARGAAAQGGLAELSHPLVYRRGGHFSKTQVDSAQMLASLFDSLNVRELILVYAHFFSALVEFGKKRGVFEASRTLQELEPLSAMYIATASLNGTVYVDA